MMKNREYSLNDLFGMSNLCIDVSLFGVLPRLSFLVGLFSGSFRTFMNRSQSVDGYTD